MAPVWKIRAGLCWSIHSFALKRPHFGPNRPGLSEHLKLNDLSTNVHERDVWVKGVYKVTGSFSRGGM